MVLRYDKLYMVTKNNSVSRIFLLTLARNSNSNFVSLEGQRRLLLQRPQEPGRETAQQHGRRRRKQGLLGKPLCQRFTGQGVLNVIIAQLNIYH